LSTLDEIKRLEEFSAENNFMFAIRPYVHNLGNAGKEDVRLVYRDIDKAVGIFVYMLDKSRKNYYIASLIYEEGLRYVKAGGGGDVNFPVCDALRRSIVMSPRGLFSPCIEFTGESSAFEEVLAQKKAWFERCKQCNKHTPCFYNDVREIGILWRKKWRAFIHFPLIIKQMLKYGNFF
jgi:MoaA/NifB/PqqE/SkfB family radical SAM enzyme